MLYSNLFLPFLPLLHIILLILFIMRLIGFIIPTSEKKRTDFPLNVINTNVREVSNNKLSHLVRFIVGFGTENSVPLSSVVPLTECPT